MRFVLLLVAVVIAVVVGVAVLQFSNRSTGVSTAGSAQRSAEPQSVATVDVMVARTPIAIGTVIDKSMVDTQPWPENLVIDGFVVSGGKDDGVIGKVARASFEPREPFMASKLANPNDPSFLAAALPAGMRAITLSTDAISGIAGYIFPGDRVDVLFMHNVPETIKDNEEMLKEASLKVQGNSASGSARGNGSQKPEIAEVVVPNLRVLAVNLRQPTGKEQANAAPSSVTVEISEDDAQKLRLAEKNGVLSLTLRSLKDLNATTVPAPTQLENLTAVRLPDALDNGESIRIVRGVGKESDNPQPAILSGMADAQQGTQPAMRVMMPANAENAPNVQK